MTRTSTAPIAHDAHDGHASTTPAALDRAIAELRDAARGFARLAPAAKAALARECIPTVLAEAPAWVAAGAAARDARPGEEWLAGVLPTVRFFRLVAESLEAIARDGRPPLGTGVRRRRDGRLEIDLFPTGLVDRVTFGGFSGHALMQAGVTEAAAREAQAAFYAAAEPEGGVSAILGAGNVSSIPALDVATKLFVEGHVALLKVSPVNEWVGPILERALDPLISRGLLRLAYGGADVGTALVTHDGITDVHITGSDRTHDLIVWGPPGPERDRRKAEGDPVLRVPITSELGNVSPVAIVPHAYSDAQLAFVARGVVTMVVNNASFNCNAAKVLITATGWAQRDAFLDLVAAGLAGAPTRHAYYPGAADRHRLLLDGHDPQLFGAAEGGHLPWALVRGLDATDRTERLFQTEPFCGIVAETRVGSTDPAAFLAAATTFMNARLWGTLNAMLVVPPALEADPTVAAALDRAIVDLRYGTVAINHWPALGYAFGTMPWGGHPSATLADVQSGLGWVHNSFMLGRVDKSVVRGPLVVRPTPVWFHDNPKLDTVPPRMADLEAAPAWWKLPGLLWTALG
jgi:acyl-CoA reductase-like NAD-dependent aldehyde dehydrogenase